MENRQYFPTILSLLQLQGKSSRKKNKRKNKGIVFSAGRLKLNITIFLAHPSRRLMGELIVYRGIRRPSVRRRRPS